MRISISATPILYHLTTVRPATDILKNNRFELKPSDGTEAEELNSGGAYYLSTTRSKLGGYTLTGAFKHSAIFVLSGTKLGDTYKVLPLDYWGTNALTPSERTKADEAEDRVLSNNPTIKATPYVIEIHAFADEHAWRLKREALRRKIPVFFYQDVKSLILMDKRKTVEVSIKRPIDTEEPYVTPRNLRVYEYQDQRKNSLSGWIELQMVPLSAKEAKDDTARFAKSQTLSKYGQQAYKALRYDYNGDAQARLNADMHNAKSQQYGSIRGERESLDKLVALLRKNKWTVKTFIKQLYDKWYPRT